MYAHGANLSFNSAQAYSRAAIPMKETMSNFDCKNNLRKHSSKHKRRKDEDAVAVVDTLQKINALNEIPRRTHHGIGVIPKDPISALDFHDLSIWLTKHKKNWVTLR